MEGDRSLLGRRRFLAIAGLIGPALVARRARGAAAQDWIDAVFPDRAHDFGTVARGSILRHSFPVENRTNQPIHISGWKAKCGCTQVEVGAREVPPGARTTVEAVLDTSRFQGYKASGVTLSIDRPAVRSIELDLSCFIQDEVVVEPGTVDFGEVRRGDAPEVILGLEYRGTRPDWRVVEMRTISGAVKARLEEIAREPAGTVRYRLVTTLNPANLRNGDFRDEIRLRTNDSERPQIPLSVSAKVTSEVALAPAVLNLGDVRPGEKVERTVLIRGRSPFQVTGATAKAGAIALADDPAAGGEARPVHKLRVVLTAPSEAGAHHAILEIATDLPDEPPARLTAFANVRR